MWRQLAVGLIVVVSGTLSARGAEGPQTRASEPPRNAKEMGEQWVDRVRQLNDRAGAALAVAREHAKAKEERDAEGIPHALWTYNAYADAAGRLEVGLGAVDAVLKEVPELAGMQIDPDDEALTLGKLRQEMQARLAEARQGAAKFKNPGAAMEQKLKDETAAQFAGDRKKIYQQYGWPMEYTGQDIAKDPRTRLATTKTASAWTYRFNAGKKDAYQITYQFEGDKQTNQTRTPPEAKGK